MVVRIIVKRNRNKLLNYIARHTRKMIRGRFPVDGQTAEAHVYERVYNDFIADLGGVDYTTEAQH